MTKTLELINEIEEWNAGDRQAYNSTGEVPCDGTAMFSARDKTIKSLGKLLKGCEDAKPVISEMDNWNRGDWETYLQWNQLGFDGVFVFQARQAKINQIRGIAKQFKK